MDLPDLVPNWSDLHVWLRASAGLGLASGLGLHFWFAWGRRVEPPTVQPGTGLVYQPGGDILMVEPRFMLKPDGRIQSLDNGGG